MLERWSSVTEDSVHATRNRQCAQGVLAQYFPSLPRARYILLGLILAVTDERTQTADGQTSLGSRRC